MRALLVLLLALAFASPTAAQVGSPAVVPGATEPEAISVQLIRTEDGTFLIGEGSVEPVVSAADANVGTRGDHLLPSPGSNAWRGAKRGALVGAIAGGVLIVAAGVADLSGASVDNHISLTAMAAVVTVPLVALTATGGALIGLAAGDR